MYGFENIIAEQFSFVKALRKDENKSVIVMRHRQLETYVVVRKFKGDIAVYKKLESISHPNLPRIYGAYECDGRCCVTEEYIDGITVADVLAGGLYTVQGASRVVKEICNALEALHSLDIIHRDIKPENVMIDSAGTVKLIDFDAARIYKAYQPLDTSFVGTAGFAAPEQYGINQTDPRSDIFALGILLNIMLTGEHPSKRLCDSRLKKVVEKCINVDPNKRYSSAQELAQKL
ncbi:MAG: serine/threonine protein kinase [Clostridia bacterium]|nr:serine/threonine protein kinase [Clostridia bacterium]